MHGLPRPTHQAPIAVRKSAHYTAARILRQDRVSLINNQRSLLHSRAQPSTKYEVSVRFNEPQKGNPNRLVRFQHVFPSMSIGRFAAPDGCVEIARRGKVFRCKPTDKLFCVHRAWNEQSERFTSKAIEDRFQTIASALDDGSLLTVGTDHKDAIDSFFALWCARAYASKLRLPNAKSVHLLPDANHSLDVEEKLERLGYVSFRSDGSLAARHLVSILLLYQMNYVKRLIAHQQWRLLHSDDAEFIVPDETTAVVIPVNPSLYLFTGDADKTASLDEVEQLNRLLISSSNEYFFARNLGRCPGALP